MAPTITTYAPYEIAPDTFLVPTVAHSPGAPVKVNVNSMVIRAAEPVVVDTGSTRFEREWLDAVGSVVDLADVKWIFLSHDEGDHVGNALALLEHAPQATLVTTWFLTERFSADRTDLPIERQRWTYDGERFSAGDRDLVAVRPPVFDGPTTRGLFDTKTGVYWAVDAFGSPVLEYTQYADELDPAFWTQGDLDFNRLVSPWHEFVDPQRFGAQIDRVQALRPSVVATCHGPVVRGEMVDEAFRLTRELPHLEAAAQPAQADLEAMLAQMAAA